MARIRAVAISIELLQEIMTQGWTVGNDSVLTCTKGLPEGAKLVNSYHDDDRRSAIIFFHHESFKDIPLHIATCDLVDVVYEFTKVVTLEAEPCLPAA